MRIYPPSGDAVAYIWQVKHGQTMAETLQSSYVLDRLQRALSQLSYLLTLSLFIQLCQGFTGGYIIDGVDNISFPA